MDLKLAIPAKNVVTLNPAGAVALCTLWTPLDYVRRQLAGVDLSPLALMGGLYGGGLKVMLRNLLHNPQIGRVVIYGKDLSGAREHLLNFFAGRVGRTGRRGTYIFPDGQRRELEAVAIPGPSQYVMDELVLPGTFKYPPGIVDVPFGDVEALARAIAAPLPPRDVAEGDRLSVGLPEPEVALYPSDVYGHAVAAGTVLGAWERLLYKLARFGRPVAFRDGKQRRELLNVKAVISHPGQFTADDLARFNLAPGDIKAYQAALLDPAPDKAVGSYTYGNRMRAHFGRDLLADVAADLAMGADSRHAFLTLWDNTLDVAADHAPCLVSLFFRQQGGAVDLAATFRSHNGARAWPENAFGLYGVLAEACRLAGGLAPGRLTLLSHSLTLNPAELDGVKPYIDAYAARRPRLHLDPNGYFQISLDRPAGEIVAQHFSGEGELLGEYRGATAQAVADQLRRREAVSDLGHALYLGGQLERAWRCLARGEDYAQDKAAPV